MTDFYVDTQVAQSLDVGAFADVGTLHFVAEVFQHFRDPRHPNAADPDEVKDACVQGHVTDRGVQ